MTRNLTHKYQLAALSILLVYCHSGEHRDLLDAGGFGGSPHHELDDAGDAAAVDDSGSSGGRSGSVEPNGGRDAAGPSEAGPNGGTSSEAGPNEGGSDVEAGVWLPPIEAGVDSGIDASGAGGTSGQSESPIGGSSHGGTTGGGAPIDGGPSETDTDAEVDADAGPECGDGGLDKCDGGPQDAGDACGCASQGLPDCINPDTNQPATAIHCVPGTDCIHLRVINTKATFESNVCGRITSDINGVNAIYSPYGYSFSFDPIDDYEERSDTLLRDDCSLPPGEVLSSYTDSNTVPPCDPVPNEMHRLSVADDYPTRLVIYVTTNYEPVWSGSSWTWGSTSSHSSLSGNFIALERVADPTEKLLIAHELGHYFHLLHTHALEYTPEQLEAAICAEIDASPSVTFSEAFERVADGDQYLVDDTAPDPSYPFFSDACNDPAETELSVTCSSRSGTVLVAPDRSNLMSYHVKDCTGPVLASLSPDQVADIDSAVTTGNRARLLGGADWITSLPALARGGHGVRITVVNPLGGVSDASLSAGQAEPHALERDVFDGDLVPDSVSTVEVGSNFHIVGRTNTGLVAHRWWDGSNWNPSLGGWTILDGIVAGRPVVVGLNGTEVHLFVRMPDDTLGQRSFTTSWSEWTNLGGSHRGDPAAVSWGPDRIDVISRGSDSRVWHKAWIGYWWPTVTGWNATIEGRITDSPSIASWGPNRLDIAARGNNGNLWYRGWTGTVWTDWMDLGGPIYGSPSLTTWGPGRLDIVVRSTNNTVWSKTWDGSWWPSETKFHDLGVSAIKPPVVFSEASGTLRYYTVGTDNNLWTMVYDGAWTPSSGWSFLGRL